MIKYMKRKIKTSIYRPVEPKAAILIIHGMCEHRKRYDDFARFLCNNGYGVITYDQLGHGESMDDTFGYFGQNGWNNLIVTANSLVNTLKEEFKDVPYYIFAHSMGSIVARSYIKKFDDKIDGLILSGAPCYQKGTNFAKLYVDTICLVKGDKKTDNSLKKIIEGGFNAKIKDPKTDIDWLSFNEQNIENYANDPLCGGHFTNRGYHDLVSGLIDIHKYKEYQCKNPDLPILFMAGEFDPCTGFKQGVEDSIKTLEKAGYHDITKCIYHNSRHEILNDNDAVQVYDDCLTWLNGRKKI